ncbi:endopeptidase La [Mycoplasmopsis felis]|uniref:endopeptidase La n=1 Tax=Mycoplasmopsis felis TaxID=33923 RepID=UPI002AFFA9EB|nr:endopeptidase La [Mycoplasmopsis felis]WQQ08824.1 endopeptidase La [Mycoplasmopsis felis]
MSKEYKVSRLLISGMTNISFPGAIHQIKIKKNELLEADVDLKKEEKLNVVIAYSDEQKALYPKAITAKIIDIQKIPNNNSSVVLTYINTGFFNLIDYGYAELLFDGKVDQDKFYSLTRNEIKNNKIPVGSVTSCYGHIVPIAEYDNTTIIRNTDESSINIISEASNIYPTPQTVDHIYNFFAESLKKNIKEGVIEIPDIGKILFVENLFKKKYGRNHLYIEELLNDKYKIQNPTEYKDRWRYVATYLSFMKPEFTEKVTGFLAFGDKQLLAITDSVLNIVNSNFEMESQMAKKMSTKLNDQHREFVIREKIKWLQEELEGMNVPLNKEEEYQKEISDSIKSKRYPESVKKIIAEETKRANEMMAASPEANISKTYVSHLKKLPWRLTQKELLDLEHSKKVLSKYHYGLEEVKQRILEYIAVIINTKENAKKESNKLKYNNELEIDLNLFKEENKTKEKTFNNVPILCLVGPPGTGKTSLSKAIAESLQRKFVKISLGGVTDESEIRGHRRTYVGAMPGKLIKGISQSGVSNPVILLDEIDKMASSNKGDPASAMLEVLDPEQNSKFQDHYLEHEYDLSKAIFIATANYYENIPPALIDRVEIIELSAYTLSEKINIAQEHLMPKVIEQVGAKSNFLSINNETMKYIIQNYTREAGVRGLKRILDKLARKFIFKKLENKNKKEVFNLKISDLEELLGPEKFKESDSEDYQTPGVVNGLAYTAVGGSSLQIEVNTYSGKGEIKLTGSLKEVMKESASISLSYVRANAERYGIKGFDFDNTTIHIHVPEGAVPKDGPSAGVTFTTALISSLSKRIVPSHYGMTGEITLRGKVLDIGGLKEKSFAASQKKLKFVFIPYGNIVNLRDVPQEIKSNLTYIPVHTYDEIYDVIFNKKEPQNKLTFKLNEK